MPDRDVLYHELLEALQAGGCPLCRLARRAGDSYLHAVMYEGITDVKLRENIREARGFCYRHAWRLAGQRGAVLGTAIIYRDIINTLVKVLDAGASTTPRLLGMGRGGAQALGKSLAAAAICPACILEHDSEQRTSHILLKHLADGQIEAAYQEAGGLCLAHLLLTLENAAQGQRSMLMKWQGQTWRQLRDSLDELIRKHDYRFQGEPVSPDEAASWERGVAVVVGEKQPDPKGA